MRVPHAVLLPPPKSSHPSQLLSWQQNAPVSPLDATLTKNRGRRAVCLTTILLTLTFGRSDLRTFASALFSANSAASVPSVLNPSFSLNFQLSIKDPDPVGTVDLFIRPQQIGFPPPHPIKSPHCLRPAGKWTGQMRTHHE